MPEIWAVLELNNYNPDTLPESSGELLAELAELVRRQPEETALCAVLLMAPQAAPADMTFLSSLGVQHIYLLEHQDLAPYTTQAYVAALAWLLQQRTPVLVATSATANGRDWMPRLAARLHLPFVPGCLGLDLHDDAAFALRVVYDGRAYIQTRTQLRGRTALATFVPGLRGTPIPISGELFHPKPPVDSVGTGGGCGEGRGPCACPRRPIPPSISRFTPPISGNPEQPRIQQLAIQAPSPEEVELDAADRIVAGGRGVGREGFTYIAAFARLLGASVGATRVATDQGWIEHARQIGTTGKSVHPRLYIACGISGAAQHIAGIRDAQAVVAINPDRTAPIFALADLGLLGDANAILPLAAKLIDHL